MSLRQVLRSLATEANSKRILMHTERIKHFSSAENTKKWSPTLEILIWKARPQKNPLFFLSGSGHGAFLSEVVCLPTQGTPSLLLVLNLRSELWE
ncbi:hypothetical protein CDAR_207651 [Caerostris darwini]|uniref:Uncharacterized protein n=1 Tax=Caerostris darwini TaxID=1538125 RepID=A0AAV4WT06_9ARAC|nr:hypothetical protein CDAR_207651 [Caerostris darwini]